MIRRIFKTIVKRLPWLPTAALLANLTVVLWGQCQSYNAWFGHNSSVHAAVAAVSHAKAVFPGETFWIDSPDFIFSDAVAFFHPETLPVCHFPLLFNPLPPLGSPNFPEPTDNLYRFKIFEHWFRNGWTTEKVSSVLTQQANSGAGWDIQVFFSQLDSWKPLTLGRLNKSKEILDKVPDIVNGYTEFIISCKGMDKKVLLLSPDLVGETSNACVKLTLLFEKRISSSVIYSYLQTKRE